MNEKRLTMKEACRRVMLRYSDLAIQRIRDAVRRREFDPFRAVSASRECWHYGLLYRDGYIEHADGRRYTGEVVYLKRGN